MRISTWANIVTLAVACGGKPSPTTPLEPAPTDHSGKATGPGAGDAMSDYSSWRDWVRVNGNAPFMSKGHGGKWVDVFIEPRFADAYRVRGSTASTGMRIVKAGYADQSRVTFLGLTVMAKMSAGYDSNHGDWYYGVLEGDGIKAKMQGKLEMCIHCHRRAKAHDYLFGLPQK